ncbi:hypothetical protein [Actinomadura chibensis]|uniref:DUF4386 domain-containing protein n=1 Tax=Actinomadura chibensis TaxID=392828 RepID=A0A5D0NYK0_9ACTN|nr:hypothetical protein [Actinomadura chibensis]TYB49587.1 hypothetical protein FXF69_11070 [Actinomadura chibensis]
MNDIAARRFTAIAGIAFSAALIVEVPLYFVYSDEPPQSNVLTRLLFGILGLGFLLVFVSGLRDLIKRVNPECEWVANLLSSAGLAYVVVTLVSSGLEAGAVIASDKPIDPTITVTGTYILYGTIGRMLLAMFLGATAYAIARTRLLPSWASKGCYVLAGVNLAFVPSLFFGNEPAHFYAANGWGTTALMGAILSYWLLAVSIALLRSARAR